MVTSFAPHISKSTSEHNHISQGCSMQLMAWTLRQEHNNSSNMIGIIKGKQKRGAV
jgi:hypothetical protein